MSWLHRVLGKDGSTQLSVDPKYTAARTSSRPVDWTGGGGYLNAMRTGTIAAVLVANANIWSFRNPSATLTAIIHRVRVQVFANIAFTAAFNDMSCKLHVARSYTVEHATSGTAATLTGNNGKTQTSMATAACTIRTLTTVNAGLTGGTATVDTDPCAISTIGKPNVVNVAAGTEYLDPQPMVTLDYEPDTAHGENPLVLVQNEGLLLQNGLVWPAAGTGVAVIRVAWSEVLNATW